MKKKSKKSKLSPCKMSLALHRAPIRTCVACNEQLLIWGRRLVGEFIGHWSSRMCLVVLIVLGTAWSVPGPHTPLLDVLLQRGNFVASFATWWIGLGVLSSVGLGSGLHSGLLFLFPHILRLAAAADKCGTTDFETYGDIWWSSRSALFRCRPGGAPLSAEEEPTFVALFLKAIGPAVLWGAGTAIGEIPPYLISLAAAQAGEVDEEYEAAQAEAQSKGGSWWRRAVGKAGVYMEEVVKKYGFVGILLMSAWPNAAFDMCGICAGHFQMPFWHFFGATLIGKALIKVSGQVCVLLLVGSSATRTVVTAGIDRLASRLGLPLVGQTIESGLAKMRAKIEGGGHDAAADAAAAAAESSGGIDIAGLAKSALSAVIVIVILSFAYSAINNLAQLRQKARRGGRAAPRSSRRGGGKKKKKRKKRKPKALKRIPPP